METKAPARARGKAGDIPATFDPHAPGAPKWSSHEAELLWPELMQWLEAKGRSPYDVMVNVVRIEPPGRAGIGEPFEAHACVGDGTNTPSSALKFMVEEFYHLQSCRTPARYELQFVWRANGQYVAHGYISLASPSEIIALRNAAHARRMYSQSYPGTGALPIPGMGRPPAYPQGQPQQQQPQQQFAPPPYGYPPYGYPPQQPPRDPELERRLAALEEENRRLRAGQAIGVRPVHPGTGAPPPASPTPAVTAADLATAMATALRAVGFGASASPAVAPTDVFGVMKQGMSMMREFRRFGQEANEMFEPPDDPDERPVPMLAAPPETAPAEDLPYDITELPSQWDDGSKAKLVRDRDTGKVDLMGMVLFNPRPAQKLMDAGAAFMERFGRRGLAGPPEEEEQPQVQFQPLQPQFQQQQPQQLPQTDQTAPAPAPPPPSKDPDGGGWID
jgi:hypothetical protein